MPLLPLEMLAIWSQEQPSANEKGRVPGSEGDRRRRRGREEQVERQRVKVDALAFEITMLRGSIERRVQKYKAAKKRIASLEHEIGKASRDHRETLQERDQRIREMEDKLGRAKELLSARTNELSGAQSILSTTDRLSEAEVLGIVRSLNENIFQVAATLTEEWEKLASSQSKRFTVPKKNVDSFSQFYGPALLHRTFHWDPVAMTFLVQSCLCHLATQITLSWRRQRNEEESKLLGSVYERLSASGKPTSSANSKT